MAKEFPGTPVKLQWSRQEDMTQGRYHPITQAKMTAALDAQGNITGLHMRISGQSILAGVAPQNIRNGLDPVVFQGLNPPGPEASFGYTAIPNLRVDHAMRNPHVPPGFWRGLNQNQNNSNRYSHQFRNQHQTLHPTVFPSHPQLNQYRNSHLWNKLRHHNGDRE